MFGYNIDDNFDKMKAVGDVGEEAVKAQLESIGFEVEDVTGDDRYRKADIDFIATKKGHTLKIEVKTDTSLNRTGNFCFEKYIRSYDCETKGWMLKCKADYYAIYDSVKGDIYIVKNNLDTILRKSRLKRNVPNSDGLFFDLCLLSINKAEKAGLLVRKYTEMEILFG